MSFGRNAAQIKADEIARQVLGTTDVLITRAIIDRSIKKAAEHKSSLAANRSESQKLADELMTCVEDHAELCGAERGPAFRHDIELDADFLRGRVECKTHESDIGPDSIKSDQPAEFYIAYERDGFTRVELAGIIKEHGVLALEGTTLNFRVSGVLTKTGGDGLTKHLVTVIAFNKPRDLGAWPETDTPDIGERYIVERMLGRQPQLASPEAPEVAWAPRPAEVRVSTPKAKKPVQVTAAPLQAELPSLAKYLKKYGTDKGMRRHRAGEPL
jgi:hypothetical protein